jgi:hypothetical protein
MRFPWIKRAGVETVIVEDMHRDALLAEEIQ